MCYPILPMQCAHLMKQSTYNFNYIYIYIYIYMYVCMYVCVCVIISFLTILVLSVIACDRAFNIVLA